MGVRVVTVAGRPFTDEEREAVVRPAWPEFMLHEPIANEHWWRLEEQFADFQVLLLDDGARVVAVGNTIPFAWSGARDTLPEGIRGVLAAAVRDHDEGRAPTTLCALQAVVRPDCQRRALSARVLEAMVDVA